MFSGAAIGLYTSTNPFATSPAGSLAVADNVIFTSPSVLEPMRGKSVLGNSTFGTSASRADQVTFYGATIMIAYDQTKVARIPNPGDPFLDFTDVFIPPSTNRMRFVGAVRSVFFNTTQGLRTWDGEDEPTFSGCPQGLNITAVNTSNDGWQSPDTAVAYRFTIAFKDRFGRIVEGAPSGRAVLRNLLTVAPGFLIHNGGGATTVNATVDGAQTPHNLQVGDTVILTPGEANFAPGPYVVTVVTDAYHFVYDDGVPQAFSVSNTLLQSFNITRSSNVTCYYPVDPNADPVTEDNFLRVYRSFETEAASDTPDDDVYQCYESAFLTPTDIAAGFLTFNDVCPELALGAGLYTNPNGGDGTLAANFQPPVSHDVEYFNGQMFFANTTNKESIQVTLIGVGAPDGLQDGDTFTFIPAGGTIADNVTFYARLAPSTPFVDFQLFDDGDPGWNIERTSRALCQALNDYPSFAAAPVFAYYLSETGIPGRMLFMARRFGDESGFTLYSSRGTAWTPQLPEAIDPAYLVKSDNNRHPAGLFWSKLNEPEAVPLLNFLKVDSDNDPILRAVQFHYRLIVWKTSGIYQLQNQTPYGWQKISEAKLIAPDSIAQLDDRLYGLTDQGVLAVSDNGIVSTSVPIDDALRQLGGPTSLMNLQQKTVGVAYRSLHAYILWTIEQLEDGTFTTENTQAWVYSTLSGGWTQFRGGWGKIRCATIDPEADKLVMGPNDDNHLWVENKTLTNQDYFDLFTVTGNIVAVDGDVITVIPEALADGNIEPGDVLRGNNGDFIVLAVDLTANTVTTLGPTGAEPDDVFIVFKKIVCSVEFNKMTGGQPATMKMFQQASFLFRQNGIRTYSATFSSEIAIAPVAVELTAPGWGTFGWGEAPYGNPAEQIRRVQPLPLGAANCCQLTVGFSTGQALAKFQFLGIDLQLTTDTIANRG